MFRQGRLCYQKVGNSKLLCLMGFIFGRRLLIFLDMKVWAFFHTIISRRVIARSGCSSLASFDDSSRLLEFAYLVEQGAVGEMHSSDLVLFYAIYIH